MAETHRNLKYSLLIVGACFLVLSLLYSVGFLSHIEHRFSDSLYGGRQPLDKIVLVTIDDKSIQSIGRFPWDRDVFASLIDNLSSAQVIAIDVGFYEHSNNKSDSALISSATNAGNVVLPVEFTSFEVQGNKVMGKDPLLPLPGLRGVVDSGFVNIQTDADGVTRAINLDISGEHDSFVSEVLHYYRPQNGIPHESHFLINYIGPPGLYERYSIVDILEGRVDLSEFDDKIVFIGATAPDLHDEYFVPTSNGVAMPGVEIHANALQTLITKRYLHYVPTFVVILSILFTCLLVFGLLQKFSLRVSGALSLVLVFIYIFTVIKLFDQGIIMNMIYVPLAFISTSSSLIAYYYVTEQRAREYISTAFGKYVSKDVIAQLLDDPSKLELGGVTRDITIFFSDIRGFTGISQNLTAEELVTFLNVYLTEMTDIILQSNGTIDKYMGDAIMGFWNAPLDQPDHPHRAAQSSLDQMKRLRELQKEWAAKGLPPMDIGIGLNTGPAVVGNVGSKDRYDYTAMGDTINLGSRLEGVNKQYGTNIIISDKTNEIIKDKFVTRMTDRIEVKGRSIPLDIYELLESLDDATPEMVKYAREFEEGLAFYFAQDWDKTIKHFKDIQKKYSSILSSKKSSQLFIDRSNAFKKNPPGEKWDGVYKMTTK